MLARRLAATVTATVVVVALGAAPAGAVVWAGAPVPGLAAVVVQGAVRGAPATGRLRIVLALAPRNQAALGALTAAATRAPGPSSRRALTPAEYTRRFAPSAGTVRAVRSWASRAGLHVDAVTPNRLLVDVSGPASAVGAAFGTSLRGFTAPGGLSYVGPGTAARLPAALAGHVSAVVGLSDLGRAAARPARAARWSSGALPLGGLAPKDLDALYDAPAGARGVGETVAVLAEGDLTQVVADLGKFEVAFSLPPAPVAVRTVDGASADTAGQDEYDLDTQYSTAFAPAAHLLVYDGRSLANTDIADELDAFVTDGRARQGSFSAGECEVLAEVSGLRSAADEILGEAVLQGQTLFTASGDTGAFCPALTGVNGVPAGIPDQNFPAASPGAVGVGGTTVVNLGGPARETAWYGSGGGRSFLEAQPAYQSGAGGSFLPGQRGVPDVAIDADPTTGYQVVASGQRTVVGGTSAGAPAWNGIWARAQGAHGGRLGFANPVLYRLPASSFHDITVGTNATYPATSGYDYVTGRGTPDIAAVVARA